MVAKATVVIDRPKGAHHPRFPPIVHPLDYGYLDGTTSVADGEGVDAVSTYILAPNPQTTRMPGAIQRFGLMPQLELSQDDARAVAEYLYATDFSFPGWYAKHYEEEHGVAPPANERTGLGGTAKLNCRKASPSVQSVAVAACASLTSTPAHHQAAHDHCV